MNSLVSESLNYYLFSGVNSNTGIDEATDSLRQLFTVISFSSFCEFNKQRYFLFGSKKYIPKNQILNHTQQGPFAYNKLKIVKSTQLQENNIPDLWILTSNIGITFKNATDDIIKPIFQKLFECNGSIVEIPNKINPQILKINISSNLDLAHRITCILPLIFKGENKLIITTRDCELPVIILADITYDDFQLSLIPEDCLPTKKRGNDFCQREQGRMEAH